MERLTIKKLILISQSESRSLEVPFSEGLNIILGGNKTGKSSIIKSIFTTFGCECKKTEKDWKKLISSYLLIFQYGQKQFCIVRQGRKFHIFENIKDRYSCIIVTEKFHEYSNCLMDIFDVKMPCVSKDGKEFNITPPLLFRFQYIDQDEGWSKIADSFGGIGYIKDWKKNTNKYVCGYLNDQYYVLQAKKAQCVIEREEKQKELINNQNFVTRISSSLVQMDDTTSIEEKTKSIEILLQQAEELRKDIFSIKAEMAVYENETYIDQHKLRIVEQNLEETEKDIKFAMEQENELICPTCGAVYSNGLTEQMGISSDYAHCEKLKVELTEKIFATSSRLIGLKTKYTQISNELQSVEQKIQKSQELLSYSSYYRNKGQYEIYETCKQQLDILQQEIDSIIFKIAKLDESMNEMKSEKRAKEIRNKIEAYCRTLADTINIPDTFIGLRDFVQKIDHTGSETPRLVYMYQSALYLYNLDRANSPFNFFVIDTPNQQGQDSDNLAGIFNALELIMSNKGQVIVGSERETGLEGKANNIISLTEKRRCLTKIKYNEHIELLQKLQTLAIGWMETNYKKKSSDLNES